jgi:glycosyltransferase involved in cell wall biosynthesis
MKIIYFLPNLGNGGAEELLADLCYEMSNIHDVTLYLTYKHPGSEARLQKLGNRVKVKYLINYEMSKLSKTFRFFGSATYILSPILSLYIFLREKLWTFDIIHANLTQPSLYMVFFKIISKIINSKSIYVQTSHSNYGLLEGFSKYINILSWHFNDVFIYELMENDIVNFKKFIPESKIHFIPFGYADNNTPDRDYSLIPELNNRDISSIKIFMTITRVRFSDKKIDVMLRAMYEYKKINRDFVFVIGGDGEDMREAKALVLDLELEDNVIFLGFVNNVSKLSVLADAYLVAVVGEDSGVSGMQAISNNVALVGVQTLKDFEVTDGIFFGNTPKKLAAQLSKLDDSSINIEYLERINKIAERNYNNAKKFTERHEILYKSSVKVKSW